MRVFVTDGNQRSALAIVRAIGRRGASVIVGEERLGSLAGASKYCAEEIAYPSPLEDRHAFEEFLVDCVSRGGIDLVIPVTDATTHLACRQQDVLRRHTAMAVPPFDAFELVTNKWTLVQSAERRGIPVPRTVHVERSGDLLRTLDRLEYPVVVKPVRSRMPIGRGWTTAAVEHAASEAELRALYRDRRHFAIVPTLIQSRIVGDGIGFFGLFDRGRLIADFAHRRLRENPPSGGVSVLRESIAVDPALRLHAVSLLGSIGWHGVAMMEYKQDRRTGELFLIEVNGRYWGSLQLAIDAGVNFPLLASELALGRPSFVHHPYRVGVKSRWLLGDLDHLLLRLFKSEHDLALSAGAPSRMRTLANFLKLAEADLHYEVIRRDDPGPFRREAIRYARRLATSAARWIRRGVAVNRAHSQPEEPSARPEHQVQSSRAAL